MLINRKPIEQKMLGHFLVFTLKILLLLIIIVFLNHKNNICPPVLKQTHYVQYILYVEILEIYKAAKNVYIYNITTWDSHVFLSSPLK